MADHYNLATFDLISIRLVVGCIQHGSLSAAARHAHLAVTAASRRIRDLENAVGEPLFVRHSRGLLPTPAGRVLMRHAVNLLQSLEQLNSELSDLRQGVATHVRLSASTAAINQFLPPLLAEYAQRARHVRVDLEEQVSRGVTTALRERRSDVGIFIEGPETHGLECRFFGQDEIGLVLPPRHSLLGRAPLFFFEALDEDWVKLAAADACTFLPFSSPTPKGTHSPKAKLITARRAMLRAARVSRSSMAACGYFRRSCLSKRTCLRSLRQWTSRSIRSARRSSKLMVAMAG